MLSLVNVTGQDDPPNEQQLFGRWAILKKVQGELENFHICLRKICQQKI